MDRMSRLDRRPKGDPTSDLGSRCAWIWSVYRQMAKSLILETTFLIDLERERNRSKRGMAHGLLKTHEDCRLFITHTVAGELAAGKSLSERLRWREFIAPFRILDHSPEVDWQYGKTFRYLQENNCLIGTNDLWIAATALAYQLPLVTRNRDHFRRVPHLEIVAYGE